MNVYQKINEVKKCVAIFKKDGETKGKGAYKYVKGSQILAMIKDKMEELGLLLLPVKTEARGWTTYNYKNSYGEDKTDFIVEGALTYEWINADDPNDKAIVSIDYYGQQNDISKAFGSALTYSERYYLLKSMGAPTDEDDPDKYTEDKPKSNPFVKASKPKDDYMTPAHEKKTLVPGPDEDLPWEEKPVMISNDTINEILAAAEHAGFEENDVFKVVRKSYGKYAIKDLTEEQGEELKKRIEDKWKEGATK